MKKEYTIVQGDFSAAGEASADIKKNLRRIGVEASKLRRTAIISYECEMNIVIHTRGGTLSFEIEEGSVTITALDEGPGIEDIEQAMKPGFSTASEEVREMGFGAGMGLNNIKKCSDELDIESELGVGTRVVSVVLL